MRGDGERKLRMPFLLLFPPLHSQLLKHSSQPLEFFAWTHLGFGIELWTNLDTTRTWHSEPFSPCGENWYRLCLPLAGLPPGRYEYTLKYRTTEQQEQWLGTMGENGIITIVDPPSILPPLFIDSSRVNLDQHQVNDTTVLTAFTTDTPLDIPLMTINKVHSYMALARKSSCWLVPVSGTNQIETDDRPWQFLMYIDLNDITWVWWVTDGSGWLQLYDSTLMIRNTSSFHCARSTSNDDFFLDTIITRKQQQQVTRGVMETCLGYCTWNALGVDMDLALIDQALSSLEQYIDVGYLIMDDGWQQQHDGYLTGFGADPHKFPLGLTYSLEWLKQRHTSLRSIGVWHTLWGSWRGIDRKSLGKHYDPDISIGKTHLVKQVDRFYNDYYRSLASAGVNFVKIDNQGGVDDWPLSLEKKHMLWDQYCLAASSAVDHSMTAPPLHSMAMVPYLLNSQQNNPTWCNGAIRNSDDFFPNVSDSHSWHIYGNLMNSLWLSSYYSTLDFDMFQSGHPFGEYHAISRAISGGPIYITDKTGDHDASLLAKLVAETRTGEQEILRCKQSCWPFRDSVLGGKPGKDQDYIGAWNTTTNQGRIYGYWSMKMDRDTQCIATARIPTGHVGYISLGLDKGTYSNDGLLSFRLKGMGGCALINIVPVSLGVACLGLLDKLNGTQAIISTVVTSDQQHVLFKTRLSHRGRQCGFLVPASMKILWAKMDGVNVSLHPSHTCRVWLLDMTQLPLDVSGSSDFSIELYLVPIVKTSINKY
ncbi:glycoside hydrolase superfamily [Chlamydoabsidia padenii]|nr:glycoside hydrolase superfamily [Chlamydoabsidia padenii]